MACRVKDRCCHCCGLGTSACHAHGQKKKKILERGKKAHYWSQMTESQISYLKLRRSALIHIISRSNLHSSVRAIYHQC